MKKHSSSGANRVARMADQIHRDIASILHNDIHDPRVAWVTINHVDLNHDYSLAKIYWLTLDEEQKQDIEQVLMRITPLIRSLLAKNFTSYTVPQIRFLYDESIERGSKMIALLGSIHDNDTHSHCDENNLSANPNPDLHDKPC